MGSQMSGTIKFEREKVSLQFFDDGWTDGQTHKQRCEDMSKKMQNVYETFFVIPKHHQQCGQPHLLMGGQITGDSYLYLVSVLYVDLFIFE